MAVPATFATHRGHTPLMRSVSALLSLLLACPGGVANAGPLATPRPARATPLRGSADVTPIERACATDVDGLAAALAAAAEHQATAGNVPLPTPHSTDVGEIAVLEDDGTFFFPDKNGNVNLDVAAAGRAFYRTHGDDYDQVALWLASGLTNWLGSPTAFAAAWQVKNAATGIGLSLYGYNAALGLPSRLQTILTMNGLHRYPNDPAATVPGLPNYVTQDILAHEFGHQWLSFVQVQTPSGPGNDLLGRALQHWSFFFDAEGSVMEGADWQPAGPDTFWSRPPIARFGPLDQYLMGVRPANEVDSLLVISPAAAFQPPGPYVTFSDPDTHLTAKGPSTRFGIEDVVAANGPRTPDAATSPHTLRMAFVLIVPRGSDATPADLAKLEGIRAAFSATVSDYTGGRMTLDATLDSRAGRLRIHHARLPDTETPGIPRPVGVRVTVDQAGIPIGVAPGGVSVRWRTGEGAWSELPMTSAGADSFATQLPGQPAGTLTQYAFRAESDMPGNATELPDLARSQPFSYHTGADVTPPVVTHWAQHAQSDERLPQVLLARAVDGLGVDSVWCESSVNGAPLAMVPAARTGADSFTVSIGAGVPRGASIAYRFVARDASLAGNLGYSNASFDTLRVGHDHVDHVWNPGPFTHTNVRFNRRDQWHVVELQGAPSGSASWHCGLDSIPYGPYQDGALASGLVQGIAAGCSLTFSHHFDLEEANATYAFDGARVEVLPPGGAWVPVDPVGGYSHIMAGSDEGLPQDAPCWSGRQDTWRVERFDLSPFAPGPIRFRFRMSADLFVGAGGWWVDDIRVRFADQSSVGVPVAAASVELGPLWPNPASATLRQSLRLGVGAHVEWTLHDVAGRQVAVLFRGPLDAGARELVATPPRRLADGLYFSRVMVNGRPLASRRVALVR